MPLNFEQTNRREVLSMKCLLKISFVETKKKTETKVQAFKIFHWFPLKFEIPLKS